MRLVDIFFKNIHGQASDIKGNLNNVGHVIMFAGHSVTVPSLSGYFELDGSTVLNAKQNYPELYNLATTYLSGDSYSKKGMVYIDIGIDPSRNNLVLGREQRAVHSVGNGSEIPGGLYAGTDYRLKYSTGSEVLTAPIIDEHYAARFFIYHGVHV